MSRLTAQQARELAIDKAAQEVDKALIMIREASLLRPVSYKNYQVKLFCPFWDTLSKDRQAAYDILRSLGYFVEEISEEIALWGNCDTELRYGTLIKWN